MKHSTYPTERHLEYEIARLRSQNAELRRRLHLNGHHARRIERAYEIALLLAGFHVAYQSTSRAYALSQGISQRSWEGAVALLRLARVVNGRRWAVNDLAGIEKRLSAAKERATLTPDAYFARGNLHMRR